MNVKTTILIATTLILNCVIVSHLPAATIEYSYGDDGRLTKADYGGIAFHYDYDLTGNILDKSIEILSIYDGELDKDGDLKLGLGEVIYILNSVAQEP